MYNQSKTIKLHFVFKIIGVNRFVIDVIRILRIGSQKQSSFYTNYIFIFILITVTLLL